MMQEMRRFLIVGLGSNLINFLIYQFCNSLTMPLFVCAIFGYSVGLTFSYTFARLWIFGEVFALSVKRTLAFGIVYAIGGFGMSSLIVILTNFIEIDYRISWCIGAAFAVLNNYFGQKYFVFRKQGKVSNG